MIMNLFVETGIVRTTYLTLSFSTVGRVILAEKMYLSVIVQSVSKQEIDQLLPTMATKPTFSISDYCQGRIHIYTQLPTVLRPNFWYEHTDIFQD